MSKTWKVLPHRPIEKLTENLWRVEGDLPNMPLRRVMTLARRSDGDLVVHNAIALEEEQMAEIDAFGKVRYIIVPNPFHRLDARRFRERYPDAMVLCPRGARTKVEEVVRVDGTYENFPPDEAVRLEGLDGVGEQEGVMVVRSADGISLALGDAVFNMPHVGGVSGFILRYLTRSTGGPCVTRLAQLLIVKDREALRGALLRLADIEGLRRVIVSHHEMITSDPKGAMQRAAATL